MRDVVVAAEKEGGGAFVVATFDGLCLRSGNAVISVKSVSRSSLFFAYISIGEALHLHGIIPREIKGEDHTLLAQVIFFVQDGTTVDDIVRKFPSVTSNLQSTK